MKLSLNWLRDFVEVDLPVPELARRLIDATAEVEGWETIGAQWDPDKIRVAKVLAVEPHPNADRLRLVTVDAGSGTRQVVCGAPNVAVGQKVAFATEGARLRDGHTGEPTVLKLRPIRGVESAGMVLSEKELGLSEEHEGILVLPGDAEIGRPLAEVLGDVVFDISTWANRADLLGVLGFARETAVLTGKVLREPDRSYSVSERHAGDCISVTIDAPDLCRRFTASVIENVTVAPSPRWMQERLLKAGMRPINNVVDITNYVMLETGQPLHAFDYDLVRGRKIVARRASPGEKLVTLDGVEREFDAEMLLICDGGGPVGIAGVMGGGNSEVSERTRNVLLEVANFRAGSIRRTSTLLKLRTEASLRFEKGIGPEMAEYAQRRALHLFAQLTGGSVAAGLVDVYPGKQPRPTIIVESERIARVLGIDVPVDDVRRILTGLGFGCHFVPPGTYSVQPPDWRPDVEIPDDVIEDIGRIHGYDKLPATRLRGTLPDPEPNPLMDLRERVRDLAAATGFQEIITYTLTEKAKLDLMVPPGDPLRHEPLAVVNPVAAQHTYLRTSVRPSVLETFATNRRHAETGLRLFEIGFEYLPAEADLPHERPVLCAVLGGPRETRWGRPAAEHLDFFDAKGAVEAIFDRLGIRVTFAPRNEFGLLEGHTAEVRAGKDVLGIVGQVHPETARAFDIDEPVFLAELWLEDMVRHLPERPEYAAPSKFPEVRQDLALVVDAATPAGRVLELVRSHRSGGVRIRADVFDEYRGAGVPEGKKSLALRLRFQAGDRTLTDSDVAKIQQGLLVRLGKELGASLRGG
ncbi:MAG TPA: phenylalanine--tRNA ligase subunit beta [Tepidiformaceae bacterium]|nr:phenylalanine--tRNA ligase subunit beta [Tepidiformaceae bacterium]